MRLSRAAQRCSLAACEVVEEDIKGLRLLTVVLDDDARAVEDFSWSAISVDLAESDPLADHLAISDLDEVDLVLIAESLDELDVLRLGASFVQDAEMGLTLVKGLGALAQTTSKTVVDHGLLQDLFKSLQVLSDRKTGGLGQQDLHLQQTSYRPLLVRLTL